MPADDALPSAESLRVLDDALVRGVGAITDEALSTRRQHLASISPETAELVDSVAGYLEGGKLLRPRFCFWGGVAALGREPTVEEIDSLARCGAAIELVQAAALMHDDVIDHSPVRRGRPSLHVEAATRHREAGLVGSAEDFGIATAIVQGDLALSWAEQVASGVRGDLSGTARARDEFDALRTEVMSGQFLDILHQAGGYESSPDAEQAALSVIRWKTVPYTVLRPVRIGAALMGASDAVLGQLSDWAIEVGTAFQLRDDLLSVVGDQDETGKPIGGDIVEGKRTVLLARTESASDDAGRDLLAQVVGNPGATAAQVAEVHELMASTGAVRAVADEIRTRAELGQTLLAEARLGLLGRTGLSQLAELATELSSLRS